jgi:hypothetical protein
VDERGGRAATPIPLYSQLRWIRFACGECGKSDTACRA